MNDAFAHDTSTTQYVLTTVVVNKILCLKNVNKQTKKSLKVGKLKKKNQEESKI